MNNIHFFVFHYKVLIVVNYTLTMSGRRKNKKTSKTSDEDTPPTQQTEQINRQPKRNHIKINPSGIAQRLNMIIDNLTFDDESPEKHVRRNVATAIKHLQGIVLILDQAK